MHACITPLTYLAPLQRLRQRQMRNFAVALLMAHGVPMIHMGDEYGHSKCGNNNTYCHDSPLNWLNWLQVRPGCCCKGM